MAKGWVLGFRSIVMDLIIMVISSVICIKDRGFIYGINENIFLAHFNLAKWLKADLKVSWSIKESLSQGKDMGRELAGIQADRFIQEDGNKEKDMDLGS